MSRQDRVLKEQDIICLKPTSIQGPVEIHRYPKSKLDCCCTLSVSYFCRHVHIVDECNHFLSIDRNEDILCSFLEIGFEDLLQHLRCRLKISPLWEKHRDDRCTWADIWTTSVLYVSRSNWWRTFSATIVLPVPTAPTSRTGHWLSSSWLIRYS